MVRTVKLASMFLGFGVLGWTTDRAVEVLAAAWDQRGPAHAEHADHAEHAEHVAMAVEAAVAERVQVDVDVRVGGSDACTYEAERRVALSAAAIERLRLHAGSGALLVEGRPGLDRVEATGRACASDADDLDALQVTIEQVGDELVLSAHYPDRDRSDGWDDDYARIDLAVAIPAGLAVDLEDSSGSLEVSRTGELRITDSSGGIRVRAVDGGASIEDGSGEIDVEDVSGDLDVRDGSGEIELRRVRGAVRIDDGSGSIRAVGIGRDFVVDDDGSGSIDVTDVVGDFRVLDDGSGSIHHSGVGGSVDVPAPRRGRRGR